MAALAVGECGIELRERDGVLLEERVGRTKTRRTGAIHPVGDFLVV